jgi:hypothetical protein
MSFMNDLQFRRLPPIRLAEDGGIDIAAYRRIALRERAAARRQAFAAISAWFHRLVSRAPSVQPIERLG